MSKKSRDPRLDHLFIYIGDRAFTLAQLGSAADKRIDQGFQDIIDQGLLGEELKGTPWYNVIRSSGLRLLSSPDESDQLLWNLYQQWKEAESRCITLSVQGTIRDEDIEEMLRLKRKYDVANKLSEE